MPVYGDCLSTNGLEPVNVSRLCEASCDLVFESGEAVADRVLTIWIGAIGPITGKVEARGAVVTLLFDEPLDERVVRHFAYS